MLQIQKEYKTPIDSNYYQNKKSFNKFEKSDYTRNTTGYTEQELKGSSTTKIHIKIQQIKYNHLKKKVGHSHFT